MGTKRTEVDFAVGQNLKRIRNKNSVSQEALANILNVSCQQVQKYEKGINRLSASSLLAISRELDEPIEAFFLGINDNKKQGKSELNFFKLKKDVLEIALLLQQVSDSKMKKQLKNMLSALVQDSKKDETS